MAGMNGEKLSELLDEVESNLCVLQGTKLQLKPDADVAELFKSFNKQFFWDKLKYVEVRWSPRMTSCAGLCVYKRRPGYCSIRLSRPLLSLRGKVDLVETLIHEMIHAFLFVTENNRDRDAHGPEFLKHMDRINKEVGLNISVYHTFTDEVRHYQQHVWLCNGPCQLRPPYFGKVYRSMNRAPAPTDDWWYEHQTNCGGSFSKVAEPEGYKPQIKKPMRKKKESPLNNNKDIRSFFKPLKDLPTEKTKDTQPPQVYKQGSQSVNTQNDTSGLQKSTEITKNVNMEREAASIGTSIVVDSVEVLSNSSSSNDVLPEPIVSASEERALEEDSASDSDSDVPFISFSLPFWFLKRHAEDPNPETIKVKKPNLSAMSKSKQGMLKNLISVPDQPTIDSFYKMKMSSGSCVKSASTASAKLSQNSQRDIRKQSSVKSFLTSSVKE